MSCHNVQAVFKGIPLFSELSSSFRDFLERRGDLLLSSEPPSSSVETQLCKNAVDNIGEALGSTAISRAVFCETTTNYVMIVPFNAPPFPCQGLILNSLVTYHVEFILTWKPNKETLKSIHFMTEEQ